MTEQNKNLSVDLSALSKIVSPNLNSLSNNGFKLSLGNKSDSKFTFKPNTQNNFSSSGTDKSQGKATNTDSNLTSKPNTQNNFSSGGSIKIQGKTTNTDSNTQNKPPSHNQNPFLRDLNTKKDNTFDDLESTSNNMPLISYLKSRHSKAKSNKTDPSKFEEINESFDTFNDSKTIVTFSLVDCTCKERPLKVNKTDKNDEHQTEQTGQNYKNQTETYDLYTKLNQAKNQIERIKTNNKNIGPHDFFETRIKHIQIQQETINKIVQLKLDIQNDINTIKNDDIVKSINDTYNEIAEKYNTIRSSK